MKGLAELADGIGAVNWLDEGPAYSRSIEFQAFITA
jgi:hypothetical protein